jgi:hypothetical protein
MAKQFSQIEPNIRDFIGRQHVFFTASAAAGSRVNISPREARALRVLDANKVVYLDQTGSGNETSAHVRADGQMTIMFCAFQGAPLILRLYGKGRIIARGGSEYDAILAAEFGGEEPIGARQMVELTVELVQTSCGYGVPLFDYAGERPSLTRWAESKGEEGLAKYRRDKNKRSIDGLPTYFADAEETV